MKPYIWKGFMWVLNRFLHEIPLKGIYRRLKLLIEKNKKAHSCLTVD